MVLYGIEKEQLVVLKKLAERLYSQKRMDADEMRDATQIIDAIVATVERQGVMEDG